MRDIFESEYKKRVPQEVFDRMMTAVKKCATTHTCATSVKGCDWLRYNPSMKLAAKVANIKSSKELRKLYAIQ